MVTASSIRTELDAVIAQAKEIENEIKLMQDLRHINIVTLLGTQRFALACLLVSACVLLLACMG